MPAGKEVTVNYREYDRLQIELGGIGDELRAELKNVLADSNADQASKQLVTEACDRITKSFDRVALLLSQALRASAE